jgi:Uma2 family endonuclease
MVTTLTLPVPATLPTGEIVAIEVTEEEYLARYAEHFHEWVKGVVIKMSPVSLRHIRLTQFLLQWLNAYFSFNPIGIALNEPFVLRLDAAGSIREPDVQVVLNDNPNQLTDTAMIGPADICIEVVSPESVARDYGDKFVEYEKAGVREYWIIDPIRQRCLFNRLDTSGVYGLASPDDAGYYHTPLLPKLALHVPTLWQEDLPDVVEIVRGMQGLFDAESGSPGSGPPGSLSEAP